MWPFCLKQHFLFLSHFLIHFSSYSLYQKIKTKTKSKSKCVNTVKESRKIINVSILICFVFGFPVSFFQCFCFVFQCFFCHTHIIPLPKCYCLSLVSLSLVSHCWFVADLSLLRLVVFVPSYNPENNSGICSAMSA